MGHQQLQSLSKQTPQHGEISQEGKGSSIALPSFFMVNVQLCLFKPVPTACMQFDSGGAVLQL